MGHVVVAGYNHDTKQYLAYVIDGDIEMDAVVEVRNPRLELFIPQEYIETGNSLAWMSKEELTTPGMVAEDALSGPYQFIH
ncbi:hypothetical protein ABWK22_02825 [Gottfriedia acidiceleris]|uniref:hypothetical protein n=1 Tax=Gottfriedia acidiceleris TaxID=371036 RepID=UPI003395CC44